MSKIYLHYLKQKEVDSFSILQTHVEVPVMVSPPVGQAILTQMGAELPKSNGEIHIRTILDSHYKAPIETHINFRAVTGDYYKVVIDCHDRAILLHAVIEIVSILAAYAFIDRLITDVVTANHEKLFVNYVNE